MDCTVCDDGKLLWRCDNYEKNTTKYKCNRCGTIITKPLQDKKPKNTLKNYLEEKNGKNPLNRLPNYNRTIKKSKTVKNYHKTTNGKYAVTKSHKGKTTQYGRYDTEEEAQYIVKELSKCGWDKKRLTSIRNKMIGGIR